MSSSMEWKRRRVAASGTEFSFEDEDINASQRHTLSGRNRISRNDYDEESSHRYCDSAETSRVLRDPYKEECTESRVSRSDSKWSDETDSLTEAVFSRRQEYSTSRDIISLSDYRNVSSHRLTDYNTEAETHSKVHRDSIYDNGVFSLVPRSSWEWHGATSIRNHLERRDEPRSRNSELNEVRSFDHFEARDETKILRQQQQDLHSKYMDGKNYRIKIDNTPRNDFYNRSPPIRSISESIGIVRRDNETLWTENRLVYSNTSRNTSLYLNDLSQDFLDQSCYNHLTHPTSSRSILSSTSAYDFSSPYVKRDYVKRDMDLLPSTDTNSWLQSGLLSNYADDDKRFTSTETLNVIKAHASDRVLRNPKPCEEDVHTTTIHHSRITTAATARRDRTLGFKVDSRNQNKIEFDVQSFDRCLPNYDVSSSCFDNQSYLFREDFEIVITAPADMSEVDANIAYVEDSPNSRKNSDYEENSKKEMYISERVLREPRSAMNRKRKRPAGSKGEKRNSEQTENIRQCQIHANQLLYIYFEQAIIGFCKGISVEQIREKFQQLWTEYAFDFFQRFWIIFGFSMQAESDDFIPNKSLIDLSNSQSLGLTVAERLQQVTIRNPELEYNYVCKSSNQISGVLQRDKFSKKLINCLTPMLLELLYAEVLSGFGLTDTGGTDEMQMKCKMYMIQDLRDKPPPGTCGIRMILKFQDDLEGPISIARASRYRFLSLMFERLGKKFVNRQIKCWLLACTNFEKELFHITLKKLKKKKQGPQKWKKFKRKWRLEGRMLSSADIVYGVQDVNENSNNTVEVEDTRDQIRVSSPLPNKHIRFPDTEIEEEEVRNENNNGAKSSIQLSNIEVQEVVRDMVNSVAVYFSIHQMCVQEPDDKNNENGNHESSKTEMKFHCIDEADGDIIEDEHEVNKEFIDETNAGSLCDTYVCSDVPTTDSDSDEGEVTFTFEDLDFADA